MNALFRSLSPSLYVYSLTKNTVIYCLNLLERSCNMIIDLFGLDEYKKRTFWIFDDSRKPPRSVPMKEPLDLLLPLSPISQPHSNAYLDLNNDFLADLVVTTNKNFEIWLGVEQGFEFHELISFPYGISESFNGILGQTLYLDVELTGKMDLLLPLCFDNACTNSTIMMYSSDTWYNLEVNFRDGDNVLWGFVTPNGQRTPTPLLFAAVTSIWTVIQTCWLRSNRLAANRRDPIC